MEFNKKGFSEFRTDAEMALQEVAKKYGVTIDCGKINYTSFDFNLQLNVTKNDNSVNGKKEKFASECVLYGFKPDDYEREFRINGKKFQLVGFNLRSPKNCCSIYCPSDGRIYKCSGEMVKRAFE